MNNSKTVIVDSSSLISTVKKNDSLHEKAKSIAQFLSANNWDVLIPLEVLSESLNTIGKLISKEAATQVGIAIVAQHDLGEIKLTPPAPHIISAALKILHSATGNPSYTDCLVIALANEHNTKYIFGFDATFKKNGYKLPG